MLALFLCHLVSSGVILCRLLTIAYDCLRLLTIAYDCLRLLTIAYDCLGEWILSSRALGHSGTSHEAGRPLMLGEFRLTSTKPMHHIHDILGPKGGGVQIGSQAGNRVRGSQTSRLVGEVHNIPYWPAGISGICWDHETKLGKILKTRERS